MKSDGLDASVDFWVCWARNGSQRIALTMKSVVGMRSVRVGGEGWDKRGGGEARIWRDEGRGLCHF